VAPEKFFDESHDQSEVKSAIVSKYFWAWANVIKATAKKSHGRIAYIDLFAGPGRFADGTKSTPLLVLEKAIADPDLRAMLVTVFNDKDENHSRSLQEAINALPGIEKLAHKPTVHNDEVGDTLASRFEKMNLVPTFFFVDPWGYKGLSLKLVNSILKDWGCDCVFFFNYNRINMGLTNAAVRQHMDALFGEDRSAKLRERLAALRPEERELAIVEELTAALKELGGTYVLPFRFRSSSGNRVTHHLFFVSKHVRGHDIMKEIMAKESSLKDQGVPSFEYNPADERYPNLFELTRPLDELEGMLLTTFAGQTLPMAQVFERHNVGRPFTKTNYKDALTNLETEGKIEAVPPAAKRRKRGGKPTFADEVVVTFPAKGG
jgi:three-Cys-motif partner protein